VLTNNGELVIVLSDGTSSAKDSHLGSLFLVQNFERYYRELFPNGFTSDRSLWRELNLKLSQGLVAMYVNRSKQKGNSTPSEIIELRMAAAAEYASTLEVLVVKSSAQTEDLPFAYIRVAGDGGVFEISNQIRELDFGPMDKKSLKNPSVSALPIADIEPEILEGWIAPGNALMIATDGIGDYITFNSAWSNALLGYAMNDVPSEQGALAAISHLDSNSRDDRSFAIVRNL
jgi:serine/threonine protein phosphatase PrpC